MMLNLTKGADDSAMLEAQINALRDEWTRIWTREAGPEPLGNDTARAISGPTLRLEPGRFYVITRDMPAIPPGCNIQGRGAVVVIGNDNVRVFHTTIPNDTVSYPDPTFSSTLTAYGTNTGTWELPEIHANGHAGTFVVMNTVARMRMLPTTFHSATGSSYNLEGNVVAAEPFISLDKAAFDAVKIGDVLGLGTADVDAYGTPRCYLVVGKKVDNESAVDRTYGRLKVDKQIPLATGEATITQHSFPIVGMKWQQSTIEGLTFQNCDWTCYFGRNAYEEGDGFWTDSDPTFAAGCNDLEIWGLAHDYCKYGVVFGPWSLDTRLHTASLQYNTDGSHIVIEAVDLFLGSIRVEYDDGTSALNKIPAIVVASGSRARFDRLYMLHNETGRFLLGLGEFAEVQVDNWGTLTASMPLMPLLDGAPTPEPERYSPFVKPANNGLLSLGSAFGVTGPELGGIQYLDNPLAWATNGIGGPIYSGYSAFQSDYVRQHRFGEYTTYTTGDGNYPLWSVRVASEAHPRLVINGDGALAAGSGSAVPEVVLQGGIGSPILDADTDSVVEQFNALLAHMRSNGGRIAT